MQATLLVVSHDRRFLETICERLWVVDGGLVAASLAAQGMAARKWIENWLGWIGVNVVSVGLYASQGLLATTGLYLLYLVMAFVGYRSWTRSLVPRA